jgi:hypothetical protein
MVGVVAFDMTDRLTHIGLAVDREFAVAGGLLPIFAEVHNERSRLTAFRDAAGLPNRRPAGPGQLAVLRYRLPAD